jgi:hypothetical protein
MQGKNREFRDFGDPIGLPTPEKSCINEVFS